jgi:hypothetical protein
MLAWKVEPWALSVPVAHAGADPAGAEAAVELAGAELDAAVAGVDAVAAGVEAAGAAVVAAGELAAELEPLLFVPHAATPRPSSAVAATVATAVREVLTR